MDATIINPFLDASMRVFKDMFGIEAKPGKALVLEEEAGHRWNISGMLGVTGDYAGIVCFRLHKILADNMLAKSGVEVASQEDHDEIVYEMVGEVVNIISGNASSKISHAHIEISPPAVIMGENHQIKWPRKMPVIGIPFSTSNGPFEVDVCFGKR